MHDDRGVDPDPILQLSSSQPRPDVDVVVVAGELDGSTVGGLRSLLDGSAADHVAVDLGGVTFVDSSGIEALVRTHKRATLHLIGVGRSRAVTRVLDLFGLSAEFDQHADVDALLDALG